jgi:hypothetical protein
VEKVRPQFLSLHEDDLEKAASGTFCSKWGLAEAKHWKSNKSWVRRETGSCNVRIMTLWNVPVKGENLIP